MHPRIFQSLAGLATIGAMTASSSAAIVSVTGQVVQIGPPSACGNTQLMGTTAFAWDEQQGLNVSGVQCDEVQNPGTSFSPTFGTVSGVVDSHFLHFQDPLIGIVQGTVTFDGPIVGVMWKNFLLDFTDASLGAGATAYPTTYFARGISISILSTVTTNANVLTFTLGTNAAVGDLAQVRILTRPVPAPGVCSLVGIAGAAALRRRRVAVASR